MFLSRPTKRISANSTRIGLLGALGAGSLTDLLIRSSPRGLEGTSFMMYFAFYLLSFRCGDLLGTCLYDRHGCLVPVIATMISAAMVLPTMLLVPGRLICTRDGEPIPAA